MSLHPAYLSARLGLTLNKAFSKVYKVRTSTNKIKILSLQTPGWSFCGLPGPGLQLLYNVLASSAIRRVGLNCCKACWFQLL